MRDSSWAVQSPGSMIFDGRVVVYNETIISLFIIINIIFISQLHNVHLLYYVGWCFLQIPVMLLYNNMIVYCRRVSIVFTVSFKKRVSSMYVYYHKVYILEHVLLKNTDQNICLWSLINFGLPIKTTLYNFGPIKIPNSPVSTNTVGLSEFCDLCFLCDLISFTSFSRILRVPTILLSYRTWKCEYFVVLLRSVHSTDV